MAAADHLRIGQHRVADQGQRRREGSARVLRGHGARVGEHRVGLRDLAERERVGLDPAAIDGGPQPLRRRAVGPRDRTPVRGLGGMLRLPVRLEVPVLEPRQQQRHRMLAGAHVADGAGLLPVTGEAGRRQRVERHALAAAGQEGLADAGPTERALDRPDVEILAAVGAGHDRELGGLQVEGLDATGLDQRHDPERLHGRAQRHDALGVAELADEPAVDVGLDDVAAVDALLDAVAQLAHEDRRLGTGAPLRARPAVPGRSALGRGGHRPEDTARGVVGGRSISSPPEAARHASRGQARSPGCGCALSIESSDSLRPEFLAHLDAREGRSPRAPRSGATSPNRRWR